MLHVFPTAAQSAHEVPCSPHAELLAPVWHAPAVSQQPPQLSAVHFGAHTLAWQTLAAPQLAQTTPFLPQAVSLLPPAHVPVASQQPLHVAGLHGPAGEQAARSSTMPRMTRT